MKKLAFAAAILFSFPALGQSANEPHPFENNLLLSNFWWSPSQAYQITQPTAIAAVTSGQGQASAKADDISIKADVKGLAIAGLFFAPIPQTKAVAGLAYTQSSTDITTEIKTSGAFGNNSESSKNSENETHITPIVAYGATPNLSVGFAYAIVGDRQKPDEADAATFHYTMFSPGVTFHDDNLEVGLLYTPAININEDDGSVNSAGTLLLHFQTRATETLAVGGAFEYLRAKELDDEAFKNGFNIVLGLESNVSQKALVGAGVSYTSEIAKDEENRTPWTIPSIGFNFYLDYSAAERVLVGGSFSYDRNGEKSGQEEINGESFDTKYEASETDLAVTATFKF